MLMNTFQYALVASALVSPTLAIIHPKLKEPALVNSSAAQSAQPITSVEKERFPAEEERFKTNPLVYSPFTKSDGTVKRSSELEPRSKASSLASSTGPSFHSKDNYEDTPFAGDKFYIPREDSREYKIFVHYMCQPENSRKLRGWVSWKIGYDIKCPTGRSRGEILDKLDRCIHKPEWKDFLSSVDLWRDLIGGAKYSQLDNRDANEENKGKDHENDEDDDDDDDEEGDEDNEEDDDDDEEDDDDDDDDEEEDDEDDEEEDDEDDEEEDDEDDEEEGKKVKDKREVEEDDEDEDEDEDDNDDDEDDEDDDEQDKQTHKREISDDPRITLVPQVKNPAKPKDSRTIAVIRFRYRGQSKSGSRAGISGTRVIAILRYRRQRSVKAGKPGRPSHSKIQGIRFGAIRGQIKSNGTTRTGSFKGFGGALKLNGTDKAIAELTAVSGTVLPGQTSSEKNSSSIGARSSQDSPAELCFKFTYDNPHSYYRRDGPWGKESGRFADLKDGKMCVARDDGEGGALFIGSRPEPTAGSTKLECNLFKTSNSLPSGCNVSLVDGYSLPITCSIGDRKIGGNVDLWASGEECENETDKDIGVCTNQKPKSEQTAPAFFQPAIRNGNFYCIDEPCRQYITFGHNEQINCHIGSTVLSPKAKL